MQTDQVFPPLLKEIKEGSAFKKGEIHLMLKIKKILSIFLLITIIAGALTGCSGKKNQSFETKEDFEKAKIGILTGSSFDLLASEYFPKADKMYYMNMTDLILNLKQNKIDGILMDMGLFTPLKWEGESLSYLEMDMPATEYAMAFPKNEESEHLKTQINEFIKAQTENGGISELKEKWFSADEPDVHIDLSELSGINGTLRVATTADRKPFDYLKNEELSGFNIELIFRFAKEYGYALDVDTIDFGALLPSIAAGRYDLAISSITVTEERKETVLFSDTYCSSPIVMAINSESEASSGKQPLTDFSTAKIGVMTGSSFDLFAKEYFPNAEKCYFMNIADLFLNLRQEKIDGVMIDEAYYAPLRWDDTGLSLVDMDMPQIEYAVAFSKSSNMLKSQMDAFIQARTENGWIDALKEKWFSSSEPNSRVDFSKLTGENGTLRVAVTMDTRPFSYLKNGEFNGFDADLIFAFAKEYGYALEIETMDFGALLPTLAAGRCDLAVSGITVTDERKESALFSDPYCKCSVVMAVLSDNVEKTLDDFKSSTLGVLTGTVYDDYAKSRFPEAERKYFNLVTDLVFAVESGKIDGFISENTYVSAARWEGAKIDMVDEVIDRTNAGYIFQKGNADSAAVREQLNAFIISAKANGLLDELNAKWMGSKEPTKLFDKDSLSGENGTLKVAVSPDLKPLSYMKNGEITGYEIEVLQYFAKEYGYDLEFHYMAFDAILPGVVSGKYDIGTGGMTITEERAESVDFSESYLTVDVVMVIKAVNNSDSHPGFWQGVKESFEKTFIREERWKLIVEGVGVTMLISICSLLAGSLFGFGLYMLSRSDIKVIQKLTGGFAKGYSRIIAGTPVVVILMILFYIVFGQVRDISGIVVAIIGFTLTFGAFVYDHMTVSVGSVDKGQTEAAYALGYTKNTTFFRIIFPQAMSIFMPSYCGQAVELIKATAVVGYIAVNDLTKMGDIIRSNTYEAFFPLIATAVIYFMLTWGLSLLLGLVKLHFEPKRRDKETILKGVKTK